MTNAIARLNRWMTADTGEGEDRRWAIFSTDKETITVQATSGDGHETISVKAATVLLTNGDHIDNAASTIIDRLIAAKDRRTGR